MSPDPSLHPSLRAGFLDGMSRAAATVSVVATDGPAGRAGVTVSAMSSVSADGPAPTLLVCVHHLSPAAPAIVANGAFCVNLLREDQGAVADRFAGRLPLLGPDKFAGDDWEAMPTGSPRLLGGLVAFDCRVASAERVGTHHVLLGEVRGVAVGAGAPLVFANRAYVEPGRLGTGRLGREAA